MGSHGGAARTEGTKPMLDTRKVSTITAAVHKRNTGRSRLTRATNDAHTLDVIIAASFP
jgi:hypothetical protein